VKSLLASQSAITEQRDWNLGNVGQILSFGRDGAGELYVVSATGRIHKLVRGNVR